MLENGYSSREQRSGVSKPFSSNIVKVLRVNNFCSPLSANLFCVSQLEERYGGHGQTSEDNISARQPGPLWGAVFKEVATIE